MVVVPGAPVGHQAPALTARAGSAHVTVLASPGHVSRRRASTHGGAGDPEPGGAAQPALMPAVGRSMLAVFRHCTVGRITSGSTRSR